MTEDERKAKETARSRAKDKRRYWSDPERMRAKNRAYHAANREAILLRAKKRYAVKKAADRARKRAYALAHSDIVKAQTRATYYAVPPEERKRRNKSYNTKYAERRRQWHAENKQRLAALAAEWARVNKDRKHLAKQKRRAAHKNAVPAWVDIAAIKRLYQESERMTRDTGVRHEVDHICPLISPLVCGLHVPWNLRVIPMVDNRRKNNRLLDVA